MMYQHPHCNMSISRLLTIALMAASLHLILIPCYSATIPDLLSIPDRNTTIATAQNTSLQILLSQDGSFAWQFVPYKNNTQRLLVILSILFNTTVVWIGNRDHPVSPNATLNLIYPSRQIILQDHTSISTTINGSSANTSSIDATSVVWASPAGIYSVLMNSTGNLVMQDSRNSTLWQSYDYPTDVMLMGQRLTPNHTVKARLSLDDVSTGHYVLRAEPGGPVLYATFDQQQSNIPYELITYAQGSVSNLTMALHSACNRTEVIYNADGSGVTLEQEGSVITPQCQAETEGFTIHGITFSTRLGGSGFRYLRLMPTGDIDSFLLSENGLQLDNELLKGFFSTYCKLPSYCSVNSLCSSVQTCSCPTLFTPADSSDLRHGCRLITPLNCSIAMEHQFLEVPGVDYFANTYMEPQYVNNAKDCTNLCLPNCSCTAAFYDNSTQACHLYDQVQTMQSGANPSVTAYLRVAKLPATPAASNGNAISQNVIVGVSVGLGVLVIGLAILGVFIGRRLARKAVEYPDSEEEAFLESLPGLPPRYSYKELEAGTEGFSKKLGKGGSGAVYEGLILPPSTHRNQNNSCSNVEAKSTGAIKVAVKELSLSERATIAASGKKQFRTEVAALGGLSHVNLVQLRGFCAEGTHRLLVYEYMENGSLDRWIFRSNPITTEEKNEEQSHTSLAWEVRYRIAVDMARGLAFLHEGSREKVVHLDVKPQNLLLDANFRAKLADFGLCKLMDREGGTKQTVTAMRGTPGYMAPEWFLNLPITEKSDVFSYGMVLLELVGGRKNLNLAMGSEDGWYFPAWAVKQAENGDIMSVIDKQLLEEVTDNYAVATESAMKKLIHVAFWCIQENPSSRPAMSTILLMLEQHLEVPEPPLELTYVLRRQSRPHPSNTNSTSSSGISSSSIRTSTSTSSITAAHGPSQDSISLLEPR